MVGSRFRHMYESMEPGSDGSDRPPPSSLPSPVPSAGADPVALVAVVRGLLAALLDATTVPVSNEPRAVVDRYGLAERVKAAVAALQAVDAVRLHELQRAADVAAGVSARMQGTVTLRVLVDETGKPIDVVVENTSGHELLDKAARDQVLARWRFQPATANGHAVKAWARVPVTFDLRHT